MDLNLVRTLVDIVEAGNLSEAARRRKVTRSHISKELKTLERQVGATLLRRTTRRLAATDSGLALYEHGLRMLAEMDAARAAIDSLGRTVRGHVRLSIPSGLGEFYLGNRLLEFQQAHPGITLRVLFSNRVADLIAAEVDVAVRILTEPPPDQVAREVCDIGWGLYAAPDCLARQPAITAFEDLADRNILCTPGAERNFRLVLQQGTARRELRIRPHLESEHFPFLRSAMLGGMGIALLPDYAVAEDVRAGRAARVLPDWRAQGLGSRLYILTLQDRHPSHAARVLIDHLREALSPLNTLRGTARDSM